MAAGEVAPVVATGVFAARAIARIVSPDRARSACNSRVNSAAVAICSGACTVKSSPTGPRPC